MGKTFGYGKSEKLKSRKQIDVLFAEGKGFSVFPLRVTFRYFPAQEGSALQAGVTASKKYFKKAVDRNRVKRLLREAYRLQKAELTELLKQQGLSGHLFFIYTDKTIAPFDIFMEAMAGCLKRLQQKANQFHENIS